MGPVRRVRQWEVWTLNRRALRYVLAVELAAVAVLGSTVALHTDHLVHGLAGLGMFLAGAVLSVEVFRRIGTMNSGSKHTFHNLLSAFLLGGALVLPRLFALVLPVVVYSLLQVRALRLPAVKATFNTAMYVVICGVASLVRESLAPSGHLNLGSAGSMTGSIRALGSLLVAAVVFLALNKAILIGLLVRVGPSSPWRTRLGDRENWTLAVVDVCAAIVLAIAWAASPVYFVVALAPVLLLQRSVVYRHLIEVSRTDTKTGLANPTYWRAVAGKVMTRVQHAGGSAAVLMVDLDHFKAVNDNFGHLVGDEVLGRVAIELNAIVRGGDLVGRFGGEEFSLLLVGADLIEAIGVADRVRDRIAAMKTPVDGGKRTARITASVGVAVFGRHGMDLEELLLGADTAMYQAKAAGRDRVFIAPERPPEAVAGIGLGLEVIDSGGSARPSSDRADDPVRWDRIDPSNPGDPPRPTSLGTPARRRVR